MTRPNRGIREDFSAEKEARSSSHSAARETIFPTSFTAPHPRKPDSRRRVEAQGFTRILDKDRIIKERLRRRHGKPQLRQAAGNRRELWQTLLRDHRTAVGRDHDSPVEVGPVKPGVAKGGFHARGADRVAGAGYLSRVKSQAEPTPRFRFLALQLRPERIEVRPSASFPVDGEEPHRDPAHCGEGETLVQRGIGRIVPSPFLEDEGFGIFVPQPWFALLYGCRRKIGRIQAC